VLNIELKYTRIFFLSFLCFFVLSTAVAYNYSAFEECVMCGRRKTALLLPT